ncbi:hypothetical protein CMK14_11630 [Candidatus Poribacteria bacterium]|nr:hypothetical protein [Candidatus Poribacteria bacterium]
MAELQGERTADRVFRSGWADTRTDGLEVSGWSGIGVKACGQWRGNVSPPPGMRNIMWKLALDTGQVLDVTRQVARIKGDQLYSVSYLASTPAVLEGYILLREMGSRGNRGDTKHVVYIDKKPERSMRRSTPGKSTIEQDKLHLQRVKSA